MTIQLLDGLILLDNGRVANHEDCCCGCEVCNGTMPAQIQVNFANIADNACDECDAVLNASFVIDIQSPGSCQFLHEEYPFACLNDPCVAGDEDYGILISCVFDQVGGDYILRVRVSEGACHPHPPSTDPYIISAIFEKNFSTTKPDCVLTGVHTLTRIQGDSDPLCDWTAATCTVEAVP